MDGILDGPINASIFAGATKDLREKLTGSWASLATDRVGHHTVKKLFKCLPRIDDKAKLVEELVDAGNRLRGNPMGRSVIETCLIEAYEEDRKEWRHKVGKLMSKTEEKFLEEVTRKPERKKQTAKSVATAVEAEREANTAVNTTTKAKRKRRRKRKVNEEAQSEYKELRKMQKPSSGIISTASIMSIMDVK